MIRTTTLVSLLVTFIILLCGLTNSVLLARWLGPVGRGEVAAALIWPSLLPYLGGTGLIDSVVYFGARSGRESRNIYGTALAFGGILSVMLIGFGYVLMPVLLFNQSTEVVQLSTILLVGIPLTFFGEFTSSLLRAKLKLAEFNAQRLIVPLGYLATTVALSFTGLLSVRTIVLSQVALYLARACVSMLLCVKSGISLRWAFDPHLAKGILSFGSKSHLGSLAEHINSRLDQALIAATLPASQLGLYTVAVTAASLITTTSQSLKIAILPTLASETNEGLQDHYLVRTVGAYWLVSVVTAPALALGAYWCIPRIYGAAFEGAAVPAVILIVGSIAFGAKDILAVGAKALGLPWLGSKAEVTAVLVTAGLLALSLKRFGIVGAACTSALAYTLSLIIVARGLADVRNFSLASLFTLRRRPWHTREVHH